MPVLNTVISFPWSDFFGMMYSDIGEKSNKAFSVESIDEAREREALRLRDSSVEVVAVMRFSGT